MKRCYAFSLDKPYCSGCSACASICHHQAIRMTEDAEGFLYPSLDKDKCRNCGLCNKVCPIVSNPQENVSNTSCVLATTHHKEYSDKSATIGVCTMVADKIVSEGGIVFGAFLNESTWTVEHIMVTDRESIEKIRNSKYAQSVLGNTFQHIKEGLSVGRKVLFIGTPCQVAGLKSFLHKDFENLYTIDLVCHGVYSNKLLRKEIEYWSLQKKSQIFHFKFRSKQTYFWSDGGAINFDYKDKDGTTRHFECHGSASPIYRAYAYSPDNTNYNLRQSCYTCHFRAKNRYGDLTIGDAWMVKMQSWRERAFIDEKNGTSLIGINTPKGETLFQSIEATMQTLEIRRDDAFQQPALKETNREIPKERSLIYGTLESGGSLGTLIESLFSVNLMHLLYTYNKKARKRHIIRHIKKLIKRFLLYGNTFQLQISPFFLHHK